MTFDAKTGEYVLSTGRRFRAFDAYVRLSPGDHAGSMLMPSPEERHEIAEHMRERILAWEAGS